MLGFLTTGSQVLLGNGGPLGPSDSQPPPRGDQVEAVPTDSGAAAASASTWASQPVLCPESRGRGRRLASQEEGTELGSGTARNSSFPVLGFLEVWYI